MKNSIFLEKASKLQKEFTELYNNGLGLAGIESDHIHITVKKFHELERENLLVHISKKMEKGDSYWYYKAMTPDGVKIIAIEYVKDMEGK